MVVGEGDLADEDSRQALRDLWTRHGLLIFRGVSTIAFQLELSRVFGPLEPHTVRELRDGEHPELYRLKYDPENDPWLYDVGGEVLGGFTPWHFDLAFVPLSNRGAMLRSVRLPNAGGKTGFIDGIEAYDSLPDDLKARVDTIEIVYQMEFDHARNPFALRAARRPITLLRENESIRSLRNRQEKEYPPVVFPAVVRHPESGRRMLHISPLFARHILGMEGPEGDALLGRLIDHITDEALAYYHDWKNDELVLWDNFRTIHSAEGVPQGESREMHRTTISATQELGRYLEPRAA